MTRRDSTVEFTAETWEPILCARVADALDAVWEHGEASRAFGTVDQQGLKRVDVAL
jgi:hypothetical protein